MRFTGTLRLMILLSCFCMPGMAQEKPVIIQLKNSLATATGKEKIDIQNKIARAYAANDSLHTMEFANAALESSKQINYTYGQAMADFAIGNMLVNKIKAIDALPYLKRCVQQLTNANGTDRADAQTTLGKAYNLLEQNEPAIASYNQALAYYTSAGNTDGQFTIYNNLGVLYSNSADRENGIRYYLKALEIADRNGSSYRYNLLNNLGKLFYETNNFPEAKRYLLRAMDEAGISGDRVTLGKSQLNYANIFVKELDYSTAIHWYDEARKNFQQTNFRIGIQTCLNNTGAMYIRQEKYEEALPILLEAERIAQENKSASGVVIIQQNLGLIYTHLSRFPEALKWYETAERTAGKGYNPYAMGELYNHRASLDSAMGNFESAYTYKQRYVEISEKLAGEKVTRQVNELQTQYETAKKEARIALLDKDNAIKELEIRNQRFAIDHGLLELAENKLELTNANLEIAEASLALKTREQIIQKQKADSASTSQRMTGIQKQNEILGLLAENRRIAVGRRNMMIGSIALVMLISLALGYSYYRRKQLRQESAFKSALLREQEEATHAILDAEENERRRIAAELHDGVGQMMSVVKMNLSAIEPGLAFTSGEQQLAFDKLIRMVDESCREVRYVSHQMMPNALLKAGLASAVKDFLDKIDSRLIQVNLHAEGLHEPLEKNTEAVLYRIIQECVNNVLKHAVATRLNISLIRDNEGLSIMIEDNGKGFTIENGQSAEGIGMSNMRSRVQYLRGSLDIDSKPGAGTVIAIHVPVS